MNNDNFTSEESAELARLTRLWLTVDEKIRLRLELPHGWTPMDVNSHQLDLALRESVKFDLRIMLGTNS